MDGQHIVIKENEVFLVSDSRGDVSSQAADGQGLYFRDTRFLSLYQLTIDEFQPVLLAAAGEFNFLTTLQLANSPSTLPDGRRLPPRSISVRRNRFLQDGLHERIGFMNYNAFPVRATVRLIVGSDFRDMFDVRGYHRRREHGQIGTPLLRRDEIVLPYRGLDDIERCTRIRFGTRPARLEILSAEARLAGPPIELEGISGHGDPRTEVPILPPTACAIFDLELPPKEPRSITVHIQPLLGSTPLDDAEDLAAVPTVVPSLDDAYRTIRDSYREWEEACTEITTDNDVLNHFLRRSQSDLRLLLNQTESGLLPMAGIPWFSVPFGRDSLITAYETLLLNPAIAYGTLGFLAQHQGQRVDDWRDEDPGKILHEIRMGELAGTGAVPFGPYFGSVDATPLFLMVLGELVHWTGDWEFAHRLRPQIEAALTWLDGYGDRDGDGYVEYQSRSGRGILNQGWKDSYDAVSYRDGRAAEPPIALCEVQGYAFAARQFAAECFDRWGDNARAAAVRARAETLRQRFEADFWLDDAGYYAIALDAAKRPVPSVASNAGHLLWSGVVAPERAARVAERLLAPDMLCGWGIRTLSSDEPTFNPMSYHNGSVWPHDNALIAAGLRRYGHEDAVVEVVTQVCEAGVRFPNYRVPELYCGFSRDRHYHSLPADYPASCRPQAWAAGSVFLLLQQLLGLRTDLANRRLVLRPRLLPGVEWVRLRRLRVLGGHIDLEMRAQAGRIHVEIQGENVPHVLVERGEVGVTL